MLKLYTIPFFVSGQTYKISKGSNNYCSHCISAISDTAPLEFFIAGNGEDYIDLNNTLLYLRIKITRHDGGAIADGANVGLLNYPGATIFSQVDVSLGDWLISQSSNTYPYRSIIDCLMNYDKHTLETLFSAGLFSRIQPGIWMWQTLKGSNKESDFYKYQ